ncbi:hypothetical protein [Parachlamydia acanthamoebae]|uniref:hypothetical protein n=1 Tax=Parachlamydia acanthamoebae TaxID=83552 RepID=UPI00075077B4|nr:hypothetical protein [Parachlamydia acanthamoebae]
MTNWLSGSWYIVDYEVEVIITFKNKEHKMALAEKLDKEVLLNGMVNLRINIRWQSQIKQVLDNCENSEPII